MQLLHRHTRTLFLHSHRSSSSVIMAQAAFGLLAAPLLLASVLSRGSSASSSSSPKAPVPGPGQIVNRHGDLEDKGNLRIADWARRWEKGNTQWHKPTVHPSLLQYAPTFRAAEAARAVKEGTAPASAAPTILVPLCGKTVDLIWLYEQGYRVIGIEIVTQAIIDFWYENSDKFPSFRAEKIAGTSAYRYTSGADDRLQILQADVFSPLLTRDLIATPAGVDVVWDRASLVALNPHQRGTYAEMIERLSAPSAQMLLNVFVYNQDEMNGPPFSVPPQAVDELYSDAKGYTRQLLSSSKFPLTPKVEALSNDYLIQKQQQ